MRKRRLLTLNPTMRFLATATGLGLLGAVITAAALPPAPARGASDPPARIAHPVSQPLGWPQQPSFQGAAGSDQPRTPTAVAVTTSGSDPTLYVGTWGNGAYVSHDRGATWRLIDAGQGQVTSIAIYPNDDRSMIMGTANLGVIEVTDDGNVGPRPSIGLSDRRVNAVAIARTKPFRMYAGTDAGLYFSEDNGLTWKVFGLASMQVEQIALDPADGAAVYVSTAGDGVYKTSDSGRTWSKYGLSGMPVGALLRSPVSSKAIYASILGGAVAKLAPLKLAKSHPGTADRAGSGDPQPVSVVPGSDSPELAASVPVYSHGPYGGTVNDLTMDPKTPTTLYAATESGMYKSTDNGDSWVKTSLPDVNVYALAVDPNDSSHIYAGTRGEGFFVSSDGGGTWNEMADPVIGDKIIYTLAVDPTQPNTIYAGGREANVDGTNTNNWGGGAFKSTDGGQTWMAINQGLPEGWLYALAIDPSQPGVLYAGTHSMGVYKSTDGGATWSARNQGFLTTFTANPDNLKIRSLAINPQNPSSLVAGVWGGGSVYTTNDGGENWHYAGDGASSDRVRTVAIDPLRPALMYAGLRNGGALSKDASDLAAKWESLPEQAGGGWSGFPVVTSVAISPVDDSTIFMGVEKTGVIRSTDAGKTWQIADRGIQGTSITGLAADPNHPLTLYASTSDAGWFVSQDGGMTWTSPHWPSSWDDEQAIAVDPSGDFLYVLSKANGLGVIDLAAARSP